jgi:uncharacterized protein YkvS
MAENIPWLEIANAINNGLLDTQLDQFTNLIQERRRAVVRKLKVNDTVRFTSEIRPSYLRGLTAKVNKVNNNSVVVNIENNPAYGRFSGRQYIRCPATLVEKVS